MNSLIVALLLVEFPGVSVAHFVQQEREADPIPPTRTRSLRAEGAKKRTTAAFEREPKG